MTTATTATPTPPPAPPLTFLQALVRQEGYYALPPSRPARNNNPGDIAWDGPAGFAARHGALHADTGPHTPIAYFPDAATGFAAMKALVGLHYVGMTIAAAITRYCPPAAPGNSPAGTETYIRNVCAWMGVPRTTVLTLAML